MNFYNFAVYLELIIFFFVLMVAVFTNKKIVKNLIFFITEQFRLRKIILKKFNEIEMDLDTNENTFNRGLLSNKKTITDDVFERKIDIIESLNPYLIKKIFFIALTMILGLINITIVYVACENMFLSFATLINNVVNVLFILSVLLLLLRKKILLLIFVFMGYWVSKTILIYILVSVLWTLIAEEFKSHLRLSKNDK